MIERIAPHAGLAQRVLVAEIAVHDLDVDAGDIGCIAPRPGKRAHRFAAREQQARDRAADESSRAGDQGLHSVLRGVVPMTLTYCKTTIRQAIGAPIAAA